jgi:hypothetical protein
MFLAISTQVPSHASLQQKLPPLGSVQTHAWQGALSHPVPAWAAQQLPPGVGVGVCAAAGALNPNVTMLASTSSSVQIQRLMVSGRGVIMPGCYYTGAANDKKN